MYFLFVNADLVYVCVSWNVVMYDREANIQVIKNVWLAERRLAITYRRM